MLRRFAPHLVWFVLACSVFCFWYFIPSGWNGRLPGGPLTAWDRRWTGVEWRPPSRGESGEAAVVASGPEEPVPAALGRIRGRIFLGEAPIPAPGASVAAMLDQAVAYAQTVAAGTDGRYEIEGLA